MFTGIIESIGCVKNIFIEENNYTYSIQSKLASELKIDQSLAHNGVCLTVVAIDDDIYKVTAIEETLMKTNLKQLALGDKVNLERAMLLNARLDGHFVQGHVDTIAVCKQKIDANGSWIFKFEFDKKFAHLIIEKGSICIDGVSLTCFDVAETFFTVAIIPYTFENTNFNNLEIASIVNLEFDIIGKYLYRKLSLEKSN